MGSRALVLGSGGLTGIAWELGLLAGLAEQGIDLAGPNLAGPNLAGPDLAGPNLAGTVQQGPGPDGADRSWAGSGAGRAGADLVVGTSAGSVVGAQITSGTPLADLYQAQLAPPNGEISASMSRGLQLRYVAAVLWSRNGVKARTRLGRISLASPTLAEEVRREVIGARLPSHGWPARKLLITAVDAETGECHAFSAEDGVPLVDAVAASCAVPGVWPPVEINGRRWMDGGMRSSANADLAAGHDRIVVIAPIAQGFRALPAVARQSRALVKAGHAVALVTPDQAALAAIGRNMLAPTHAAAAAKAGHTQARTVAEAVATVWGGGPPP
jgi:NTE family protein